MIRLDSKGKSSKRFIAQRGLDVVVDTTFWVTEDASVGEKELSIRDTLGLLPGAVFQLGESEGVDNPTGIPIEVAGVSNGIVTLTEPLAFSIPANTLIKLETKTKALFVAPGRQIIRDVTEMNRQVRVSSDTIVTTGSIATFQAGAYFVTGYQVGDSSIVLGLKLINETLDWYSLDPEDEEQVIDWTDPQPAVDRNWPSPSNLISRLTGIPTYQEQISLFSNLEEPGHVQRMNRMYVVQSWFPISTGHIIKSGSDVMRVTGVDLTRIRNMRAIYVEAAEGVELDG